MLNCKDILRSVTPPVAWHLLSRLRMKPTVSEWHGDYGSWTDATKYSLSYNTEDILKRVVDATIEVEAGRAACERDGCNFTEVAYSWPLLSSLLWVFAREKRLTVMDIGGSLGTTWRQNRKFLGPLSPIEWMIVEQPEFVQAGRDRFRTAPLSFHISIAECRQREPNVALLSSSLQYMSNPWALLDELAQSDVDYLILDRTPMTRGMRDRLTVQTVAPHIYTASYPCWLFSHPEFERKVTKNWRLIESWQSIDEHYKDFDLHGCLLVKQGK